MSVNWDNLRIEQAKLDEVLELNILSTWAITIVRVFILRQKAYYSSLLLIESSLLFLIVTLLFPLSLIIFRNLGWLENNTSGFIIVLLSAMVLSVLAIVMFNYYLWGKAKQLKVLATLLEKVNQYNSLIDNFRLLSEINSLKLNTDTDRSGLDNQSRAEIFTALDLTKKSLIKSIELEKIINRDRQFKNNRDLLLANIEDSLINLISFPQYNSSNDYQQILTEAIEIGLSVHREIRKMKT